MRLLVDADSCPVVDIIEEIARKFGIVLSFYADIYHQLSVDYGEIKYLDRANQSVDMEIYNECKRGDIVITQDYGLAALVLGKGARAINQNGMVFDKRNIDHLLAKRHVHAKIRRAGGRHPNHKKRTRDNDIKFKKALEELIKNSF